MRNEQEIPGRAVCPGEKKEKTRREKPFEGQGLDLSSSNGLPVCGEHSQYLPGVLEATQWTVRSPVFVLDSTLRSVGGDKAARTEKRTTIQA